MLGEMKKRVAIAFDAGKPCELRVFACLELFCFPVSMITVLLIPVLLINRYWWGCSVPVGLNVCIKILLAAATGYITNYIAVEMLFKPYHESKRHALSLLTLGYWSQGLVPRNKNKIGRQLGAEAETLIPPDKIANDLCKMVAGLLDDETNLCSIESAVRNFLVSKEELIVSTSLPVIEKMCVQKISEFVSEERVMVLWNLVIKPKLASDGTKELVVKHIIAYVNSKVPELMPTLKEEVRKIIYDFLQRNELFQSIAAAAIFVGYADASKSLADNIVDEAVDWDDICRKICNKIGDKKMQDKMKLEVQEIITEIEKWLASENGVQQIGKIVDFSRVQITQYLATWLRNDLRKLVSGAIRSDGVWGYVRNKMIPEIRPPMEKWLKGAGKDLVMAKLNLSERIASAVDGLSVEEFHERVNTIAAQHLGAIQVLGYFLGAIVGVGLLVVG